MPRIGLILGSTRPNRLSATVAARVLDSLSAYGEIDLIDLAEVELPFYDEPKPAAAGDPVHEHTLAWGRRVEPLDAFVIVTPEYNAGYPAVLKNAIDFLYAQWQGKPVAVVAYGWHGGRRVMAALSPVLANVKLVEVEGVQLQFGAELTAQGAWDADATDDLATRFSAMGERLVAAVAAPAAPAEPAAPAASAASA